MPPLSMRILYYETTAYYPSSAHFLEALRGLSRDQSDWHFSFFDEAKYIAGRRSWPQRIVSRLRRGQPLGCRELNRAMLQQVIDFAPDLVIVGKGQYLSPATLREIKAQTGATLVNWATDDPFNPRNSSPALLAAIPHYDLYVSTKRAIVPELERVGATKVSYVRFGYKSEFHYPERPATQAEIERFGCDVVFIGGADKDRIPYFMALVEAMPGIRLKLYGGYWHRYPALRPYWCGEVYGRDYRLALAGACIAVNLVRRSNRDDHVMRTFEIPACGAFMLAERTETHAELFEDGRDAAFFVSKDEFVDQVRRYLPDESRRREIAAAARARILAGRHSYRDRLLEIVEASASLKSATPPVSAFSGVAR